MTSSSLLLDDVPWRVGRLDPGWLGGGHHVFIIPAEYLLQDAGYIYEITAEGITFHLMRVETQE